MASSTQFYSVSTSSRYSTAAHLDILDSSLCSHSTKQVNMTPSSSSVVGDVTPLYQLNENSTSTVITLAVALYTLAPHILSIMFYTISALRIVLNLFTITIIGLYKPMHKQWTNMLIVNQSINDTFAAIFLLFSTVFPYDFRKHTPGNVADEILCRIWFAKMPMYSFILNSTYGIVGVTFERFLVVVYPIWHKARFRRKQAAMIILVS